MTTPSSGVDLDAYCTRIGYRGVRTPTLDVLRALHLHHPQTIPFENLSAWLGHAVPLDESSLQRKLVDAHRGGYCFEHNLLFAAVLRAIGFQVTGLAARALWSIPAGVIRPRSHMLLKVSLDEGEVIADVGFGGLTLTAPLRLLEGEAQETPHEPARLTRSGDCLVVEVLVRNVWSPMFRFGPEEHVAIDYEMANWYVATHPGSPFVNNLVAARVAPGCRYGLMNNELVAHVTGGASERRVLSSADELRHVLEETFGIDLPDDPGLDGRLSELAERRPT